MVDRLRSNYTREEDLTMRKQQREIVADLHVRPSISASREIDERTRFLMEYVRHAQAKALVLGVSGGQDSSLAGRLCQLAVEGLRREDRHHSGLPVDGQRR